MLLPEGVEELPEDVENPRLILANWLANPEHPLTARVFVNRIWTFHFGKGIVNTPNDFGFMGDRPSHPELLDWLATEYMANGWRMKPLHKMIMMSAAYRQASENPTHYEAGMARTPTIACCGMRPCAGSRPKRCATPCCRSPAD